MNDERRRFSDSERAALFLAADGRCAECGALLEPGWHADHDQPWSRGGATDVINGRALCPPCNLRKGNRVNQLRAWQQDALAEWQLWTPKDDHGFLVEATPGAGKTRFAIEAARRLLAARAIERIVVAVPTGRLEGQWAEDFSDAGISINPHWHAANGTLAADERGCAATYSEIGNQPYVYRKLASDRPTLVILDEVHHCGEDRQWGAGVRKAFEPAVTKLLLSGTPFRSDNNEIPFVNYVDGVGAPDFRYGYDRALGDGVVRAAFFPRRGGQMEWTAPDGAQRAATFDDPIASREAGHRLRTALSVDGEWLPSVLRDAHRQLCELQENDPDAAAIVFCEDADTARAVHGMLREVIGRPPVLAITDEPDAAGRIKRFKKSGEPWIVTIRMVSEGVNIPRLRVGVYATPWVTELFFRQVVGRIVRVREGEDDPTAYLFIPDDDRLRTMAAQIKAQRDHQLEAEDKDLCGGPEGGDGPGASRSLFAPISAVATDQGVLFDTDTVSPGDLANAERVKRMDPTTARLPTPVVAALLRNAGSGSPESARPDEGLPEDEVFTRKERLRRANNKKVVQICKAYGLEYGVVNNRLYDLVRLPYKRGLHVATEEQLRQRLTLAGEWLKTGVMPGGA
jgi:superfamily II DNA or RNA helicase